MDERRRIFLAVSGTLQDGHALRVNLDHAQTPAVLVGWGVVRGVKAYVDVKEPGSREHVAGDAQPCNPACVVTADRSDANLYALYLVDERAAIGALLGEPRYLAIAPDSVRIDLEAKETSAECPCLTFSDCHGYQLAPPLLANGWLRYTT
ncbi:hypothetical protein T492DRAFT_844973 [Pavlovales sp. CCMP2436]|nr:hypothetical protein T492DRAFT_844973 [Pavlovales sp. CCMP2436]